MTNNHDINLKIQKMKEYLFEIHSELLGEIKGKPVDRNQDEYEESPQSIRIPKIIQNIKETIQLLLEKRIDDFKNSINYNQIVANKPHLKEYEFQLRQYEANIRKQYKREIISKMAIGISKHRLDCYEAMEDEFEDMKEKLKYEDGQFLNNDRKDNEILILRAENANLKDVAQSCQKKKKEATNLAAKNQETITQLKARIEKLTKKIEGLEKNPIQIDSKSNSSINININNGHSASKWIIKHEDENQIPSSNISTKNKRISEAGKTEAPNWGRGPLEAKLRHIHNNSKNKRQEKSSIVDTNAILNKYSSYLNDYEDKTKTLSQGKTLLQKSNSLSKDKKNEKINFNGNSGNSTASVAISKHQSNNYVKITSLIPLSSKIPSSSRTQNQQLDHTMSKMYVINNSGSKSTNRSSLNLRSSSKFNN